jgi:hypothetical protein
VKLSNPNDSRRTTAKVSRWNRRRHARTGVMADNAMATSTVSRFCRTFTAERGTAVLVVAAFALFGVGAHVRNDSIFADNVPNRTSVRTRMFSRHRSVSVSPATPQNPKTSRTGSTRVYVFTLDGVPGAHPSNIGRLKDFRRAWSTSCPNDPVDFEVCLGGRHPIRGHGLTSAITQCLERSMQDVVDGAIFLEDDARLEGNATEFCNQHTRDDFVKSVPSDALLVFIGAHAQKPVKTTPKCHLQKTWVSPKQLEFSFRPLKFSLGTYVNP